MPIHIHTQFPGRKEQITTVPASKNFYKNAKDIVFNPAIGGGDCFLVASESDYRRANFDFFNGNPAFEFDGTWIRCCIS